MSPTSFSVQKKTLFSESIIWQLNRDFYHQNGIAAWTKGIVPHEITNSSLASTTYAELIFAFLKDLAAEGVTDEIVYILELGAGHGKLCYKILQHLDELVADDHEVYNNYCYVLSDIVEENLSFLSDHPKLQKYFDREILDVAYFDAVSSQDLMLQKSARTINAAELNLPILTLANYFFDSIPSELYYFGSEEVFSCSVSADSMTDPKGMDAQELIKHLELTFHKSPLSDPILKNKVYNEILNLYSGEDSDTYILFPKVALECLSNISALSSEGMVLLTMDKGYKELQELARRVQPDLVKHGSFSLWVNFHAMSQFCIKSGGYSMFDSSTNLSIELGCLFFTEASRKFPQLEQMYRKHSRHLNLEDFNIMKKFVFKNVTRANLSEVLGLLRLSSYDSGIFIKLLPSIKQLSKQISFKQRSRLRQTIDHVWTSHYPIKLDYDLSYELGGLMYDLGYYAEALVYFDSSMKEFGNKVDVNYNQILCHFQLRQDELFHQKLKEAKLRFPGAEALQGLEKLNLN